jgi:hypothetical protein
LPKSFHGYAEFADKQERELKANRLRKESGKETDKKSSPKLSSKPPLSVEPIEKDEDGDTVMTDLNSIRPDLSAEKKAEWMKDCRARNLQQLPRMPSCKCHTLRDHSRRIRCGSQASGSILA